MTSRRDIENFTSIVEQFMDDWRQTDGQLHENDRSRELPQMEDMLETVKPLILAAPSMKAALEEALYALNAIPNRRLNGPQTNTYEVARIVEKALEEARG